MTYSLLDRLIHRLAFSGQTIQTMAAEFEDVMFKRIYGDVEIRKPVFITSLPRTGTTVLLEALHRLPGVATHLYRDMPFVMAPVLWSRLTGSFRKPSKLRERAHGDGIHIGYDSPEAFEEVVWKALWPRKYEGGQIALWSASDASEPARRALLAHMQKIVALRCSQGGRYVSKNNGNLARLDIIPKLFPDAVILVPLRRPMDHARSLLRQHRRFLERHEHDPFARRYMADIGHFEFGALHRPIAFPGLADLISGREPLSLDYWVGYWIAAFEHVLARRQHTIIVSHEALCRSPQDAMVRLCDALGLSDEGGLSMAASVLRDRAGASHESLPPHDRELLRRADELHAELVQLSLA